jgi:replicative DNA helicase
MPHDCQQAEQQYLACCYLDADAIDKGLERGLTDAVFTDPKCANQWALLVGLRCTNQPTDLPAVAAAAAQAGTLDRLGGYAGLVEASRPPDSGTSARAGSLLSLLLDGHARREAWKLLTFTAKGLGDGTTTLADAGAVGEKLANICAGKHEENQPVSVIANDSLVRARATIAGQKDERPSLTTGIPSFDAAAGPMHYHEYVVVAARSSHGKSSLVLQIAGHNLAAKKRVAIFTLETSATSVVEQIAAQRSGVNLRDLATDLPDHQRKYLSALEHLSKTKDLLVFDRDLSINAIMARCRALSRGFKPDLVVIDYLGLITGFDGSNHERAASASKAMIPLKKMLGCPLMVAAQLNQGPERDGREPSRTDFRDSGTILEDAHRVIAVHREPGQPLDNTFFAGSLLQLKNRDGPLAKVGIKFNARCTRFSENGPAHAVI